MRIFELTLAGVLLTAEFLQSGASNL